MTTTTLRIITALMVLELVLFTSTYAASISADEAQNVAHLIEKRSPRGKQMGFWKRAWENMKAIQCCRSTYKAECCKASKRKRVDEGNDFCGDVCRDGYNSECLVCLQLVSGEQ
ncbi:uncharacterized protein LOC141904561 [Tubulanus polymorphus]|uniref:uncharacterized protein LOC141904561 n=1 Tax=Tubulanus polymorphus TaxID=672921 RepID=UPI003DA5C6DF